MLNKKDNQMTDHRYPKLNPEEIIQPMKLSYQALLDWLPVQSESSDEKNLIAHNILMYTPRFLYDFFDDQKMYISINYHEGGPDEGTMLWSINDGPSNYGGSRIDAEEAAFKEAFKQLEIELNKNQVS